MRKKNRKSLFVLLLCLLGFISIISLKVGTISLPLTGCVDSVLHYWGLPTLFGTPLTKEETAIFWFVRLPRIGVAILVGGALAISGTVMQAVFMNPLAEPGIMGVSAGASFGAVLTIALGLSSLGMFYTPIFAFVGALGAVFLTVLLTFKGKKVDPVTLLLGGIGVSLFLGALTSGVLTFMNEYRLREFMFWMVGGLDFRRWEHVTIATYPILVGFIILLLTARHLDILSLGDTEAKSMGMPVIFYRLFFLIIASLLTAVAVCVSGTIGFVGLIIPHIMRMLVGPNHQVLLPTAALGGATFLVFCDTLGRLVIAPLEIRVGIVAAVIGAPYFLYLLRKLRSKGGV